MIFSLEAVHAREGDALLLHYGPNDDPACILIDGGARGVYKKFLKPRIAEIREHRGFGDDEPLPLRMMMVSHIDADHISGILDLVTEMEKAKAQHKAQGFKIETLWHNAFDDIIGNEAEGEGAALVSKIASVVAADAGAPTLHLPAMNRDTEAVVASTKQGRDLQRIARNLRIPRNEDFDGLVMARKNPVKLGHDLEFTVIGPLPDQVEEFQKRWDKDLPKILADEEKAAEAQAFSDESPFNLASIAVLARRGSKSMLLTGDARGDFIVEGLVQAGILHDGDDSMDVDILKLPHHGSERNVEQSFFEQIRARHYVISADGRHHNPDVPTLQMLAAARGSDPYTLHLTFEERAFENTTSRNKKEALKAVHDWITAEKPANCEIRYRDTDGGARSVVIDLEDEIDF